MRPSGEHRFFLDMRVREKAVKTFSKEGKQQTRYLVECVSEGEKVVFWLMNEKQWAECPAEGPQRYDILQPKRGEYWGDPVFMPVGAVQISDSPLSQQTVPVARRAA